MNRPKLEIASWIAGIVSALVALYLVLPSRTPTQAETVSTAESGTAPRSETAPSASNTTTKLATMTVQPSSIKEALVAATQIPATATRDAELDRLARLATSRHEYQAALVAATAIYATTKKDEMLDLIHCYSSFMGDTESTKEAAKLAYSTATKNSMHLRASKLSSQKPGEGGNDMECRAL